MADADGIRVTKFLFSPENLAGIGAVVVETTYCEVMVGWLISVLLGVDESQGRLLTERMQLDKRLDLMGDLWKQKLADDPKRKARLTELVSDLKEANNARNTVVHGQWLVGMDGTKEADTSAEGILSGKGWLTGPYAFALKRRLKSGDIRFRADQLDELAERISVLTAELTEFAEDWGIRVS